MALNRLFTLKRQDFVPKIEIKVKKRNSPTKNAPFALMILRR